MRKRRLWCFHPPPPSRWPSLGARGSLLPGGGPGALRRGSFSSKSGRPVSWSVGFPPRAQASEKTSAPTDAKRRARRRGRRRRSARGLGRGSAGTGARRNPSAAAAARGPIAPRFASRRLALPAPARPTPSPRARPRRALPDNTHTCTRAGRGGAAAVGGAGRVVPSARGCAPPPAGGGLAMPSQQNNVLLG